MLKKVISFTGMLLLGGAAILWSAGPAAARGGGGGGHGGGGGGHGGGGGFHGGGGGFHGGGYGGGAHYGGGHWGGYGGYHGGYGYHNGGYWNGGHYGHYGYHHHYPYGGWGWGYPYYGSYGYYPYSGYYGSYDNYYPSYDNYPYDYGSGLGSTSGYDAGYAGDIPPAADNASRYVVPTARPADNTIHLTVKAPANAEIWIDDTKSTSQGPVRQFRSPPVTPGEQYTYQVRAHWNENGKEMNQTQKVKVTAGAHVNVSFPVPPETAETKAAGG